jgi:hypothetical protein
MSALLNVMCQQETNSFRLICLGIPPTIEGYLNHPTEEQGFRARQPRQWFLILLSLFILALRSFVTFIFHRVESTASNNQ